MHRLVIALAIVVFGCGAQDDRARNLDYITEAILKPSCGGASCHSAFRQKRGYAFDSIAGALQAFQGDEILMLPSDLDQRDSDAGLIVNLTSEGPRAPRMPYTAPLPDADVELIRRWLHDGGAGTCKGTTSCLGPFIVPCIDNEAYNLDLIVPTLDAGSVTDCADLGARMNPPLVMTCRASACVEVKP